MVLIFICFDSNSFGFQFRYMYSFKRVLFMILHVLEPSYDYIETNSPSSILFKASPTTKKR